MFQLLAAIAICQTGAAQATFDLVPTDDVWVYPFASDPSKDEYLRLWGSGGKAVAGPQDTVDEFSYSYLKWSLKDVPIGSKLVEAKLILTHIPNAEVSSDQMKKSPIEVRSMPAEFTEKTWQHEMVGKIAPSPDAKSVFGTGAPDKSVRDKATSFEIDLLKGPGDFKKYFADALAGQGLALALTSTVDPSELGRGAIYKLFSKDGPKEYRPILRLRFQSGS